MKAEQKGVLVSDNDTKLVLEKRDTVRKGLNSLKTDGIVPAVIHEPGKDSVNVQGKYIEMVKAYEQVGKSQPVSLKVGDEDYLTMIKEVDFDPKKHQLRHVVFGAIKKGQKVKADVSVVIVLPEDEEQTPAEQAGLIINKVLDSLEIEAIPSKLIEQLEVDGSNLKEVGDKLHISDITVPDGVEVLEEDKEKTIVTVEAPRVEEEPVEAEAEEGEEPDDEAQSADSEGQESSDADQEPKKED